MFLQIVTEGVPSATDTHHHVAAQDSYIDCNLGVADPVLALGHVYHWELRWTRALFDDIANLRMKNRFLVFNIEFPPFVYEIYYTPLATLVAL